MGLWTWFRRRRQLEEDLEEEVRAHLRMAAQERTEHGESTEQARASALREFGNVTLVKEVTRDVWGWRWLENLTQDLSHAVRMLRKNPGFALVAIVTLALGIGATTAIFSVIDATMLRPLPYERADELVDLSLRSLRTGRSFLIAPETIAWKTRNHSFSQIESFGQGMANLTGAGDAARVVSTPITAGFFHMLGIHPLLGRDFLPEESTKGRNHVLLISAAVWRGQFGARPSILGATVHLDGTPYTVIGVMPVGLLYPPGDVWFPLVLDATNSLPGSADWPMLTSLGRLKTGAAPERARSDLQSITDQLTPEFAPGRARNLAQTRVEVVPLRQVLIGDVQGQLWILLAAVGCLLLVACTNVAGLLLARAASRRKEVVLRSALGARRWRLVCQLLAESLLLAAAGGTLGLLVGLWGVRALKQLIPPNVPAVVSLDLRVLAFVAGVSVAAVVLFGLLPAVAASRTELGEALKQGGMGRASRSTHRLRGLLVVTELALSLILLTGAGLLARSFWELTEVKTGFDPHNVLAAQIWLPSAQADHPAQQAAFFHDVLERLRTTPEVTVAAATTHPPVSIFNELTSGLAVSGRPEVTFEKPASVAYISSDYFLAMRIRLLEGRFFTGDDGPNAPSVAILTESLAHACFEGESPIGHKISMDGPKGPWHTVVGVVADTRNYQLERAPWPEIFFPYTQNPSTYMAVILRTSRDPLRAVAPLRSVVKGIEPNQPVSNIETMDQIVEKSVAPRRFKAMLLGLFAALAMVLAGVGLYGLMAQTVTERTQEIGIRLALGAHPQDVLSLMVRRGLRLTLTGLAVGLAGSFFVTRYLASMLFTVKPTDPLTFIAVAAVLAAVGLSASYIPARRATRVDPTVALRYE